MYQLNEYLSIVHTFPGIRNTKVNGEFQLFHCWSKQSNNTSLYLPVSRLIQHSAAICYFLFAYVIFVSLSYLATSFLMNNNMTFLLTYFTQCLEQYHNIMNSHKISRKLFSLREVQVSLVLRETESSNYHTTNNTGAEWHQQHVHGMMQVNRSHSFIYGMKNCFIVHL